MQLGIANGIPLNEVVTGDDLIPAYDQSTGTEGYVNLNNAVQKAFSGTGTGTANGVLYLNSSKVTTSASTLMFDGNLLIGTTSKNSIAAGGVVLGNLSNAIGGEVSGGILTMAGATTLSHVGLFSNPNGSVGSITIVGTTTAYNTASDYRLKDNQAPLTDSGSFIDALKPKTWNWKADGAKGVGFIAHEVQEVSQTSVVGEKDATRIEQYEVSPAIPATYDEEGNELTSAVEAVMGEREVPAYQAMEYGSAEFIANIVAELQSLRKRVAALEAR